MTCLEHLLHALAVHGGGVVILERTLRQRAAAELHALRPDLPFRKQVAHWAAAQHLLCRHDPDLQQFTFSRTSPP